MPIQKPRRSTQEVGTPRDFLGAVEARFGRIALDVAANAENAVCPEWFGPGSRLEDDALTAQAGAWEHVEGWSWLNPPFGGIGAWAERAVDETAAPLRARVLMLVPASVGSNWFNRFVRPHAYVLELAPRIRFVGHPAGFPKDLLLCVFTPERLTGRKAWRWKK